MSNADVRAEKRPLDRPDPEFAPRHCPLPSRDCTDVSRSLLDDVIAAQATLARIRSALLTRERGIAPTRNSATVERLQFAASVHAVRRLHPSSAELIEIMRSAADSDG